MIDEQPTQCRSCGAEIVFGYTAAGKRCPYDFVDGQVTSTSHFATCDNPKRFSSTARKCARADGNCEGSLRKTTAGTLCGWHTAVVLRDAPRR